MAYQDPHPSNTGGTCTCFTGTAVNEAHVPGCPFYPVSRPKPSPCPSCGRCPTCGRGRNMYPWISPFIYTQTDGTVDQPPVRYESFDEACC